MLGRLRGHLPAGGHTPGKPVRESTARQSVEFLLGKRIGTLLAVLVVFPERVPASDNV